MKPGKQKGWLILGVFLEVIWLGIGCNPYKMLPHRAPETAKDSLALMDRCIKAAPIDTATNTVYIFSTMPDSSQFYRSVVDSITRIKEKVLERLEIQFKDTCIAVAENYSEGFKTGYSAGYYTGKGQRIHDTSYVKTTYTIEDTRKIVTINELLVLANKDKETYRARSERRGSLNFILMAIITLLGISCVLLWKFRRSAAVANNLINKI